MIVQSRMGATRLPGKSMMDLAGAPLISRLLERVRRCKLVDEIVLATTRKSQDDVVAEVARGHGLPVFRGSENDLVDRYRQAARAFKADVVVRLPGDNPAPEPAEIDDVILYHLEGGYDFSTNCPDVVDNGYPDGIGAEVLEVEALERVWRTSTDPRLREHPHFNFYENPGEYKLGIMEARAEIRRPDIVIDVNTQEQYEFVAALYAYLYPRNPEFTIHDVIDWYDNVHVPGRE
jgi:spore coat polysaccharide biosynthesis protein SpsF